MPLERPEPTSSESGESPVTNVPLQRKRRRFELVGAAAAFIIVLLLTWLQLDQFRTGDRLFMAIFNVNFVLLLGILLVVLRNGFKLLLERRRRILGSRLRTRLVLAFVALSLLPCLLMLLVTTKYVQLSMDFWFKEQVETSMETALDMVRALYEKTGNRLVRQGENMMAEASERRISLTGQGAEAFLEKKRKEYRLAFTGVLVDDVFTRALPSNGARAWAAGSSEINWETLRRQKAAYALMPGDDTDYVFCLLVADASKNIRLVLAEDVGSGFKAKFERIARGSDEYGKLRKIKQPLKLMLYSSLGVLASLIILGATWYGFRVAREMTAPIRALAAGTERVARGDLSVRLADASSDELGMLIRSFNLMARDLERSRQELTGANAMLEEQNLKIARHSKYIETVLNNIAAGVISFDHEGVINTVNRAACDILGKESEDLVGKHPEDVFPDSHTQNSRVLRDHFVHCLESRVQHSITVPLRGEERRLLINSVGFTTDGVYRGAVAVFEDISELERMQRMAAWREVARRIAHEIKNPLTPIKLSAQRLARKFGSQVDDPAFSQSTQMIVRQVEHLQEMVQEFSAFAKLPEVKPQPGRIEPLLEGLTEMFRNSHAGIRWELEMAEGLPVLAMDREALSRAFMNIYANAAEALILSQAPAPFVRTSVACNPALSLVRIDVADNGPGLTEEERARVFEPYFSHKKGGTGLGLTIVRSIVSDHRGYVRAQPREGGGTVFTLELPLV